VFGDKKSPDVDRSRWNFALHTAEGPLHPAKFTDNWSNVSNLLGEKPENRPAENCNTGVPAGNQCYALMSHSRIAIIVIP